MDELGAMNNWRMVYGPETFAEPPRQQAAVAVGGPFEGRVFPCDRGVIVAPAFDPRRFDPHPGPVPATQSFARITYTLHRFAPCWAARPVAFYLCDLRDVEEYAPEILARFFYAPVDIDSELERVLR